MPGDLNRCEFIGRLGADPDCHAAPSGVPVTRFSIAVNSYWKDKSTGERQTATQWVRIVTFRRLAEICSSLLYKGARVFVAGEFATSRFERDGHIQFRTEVIAREMQLLERGESSRPMRGPGPPEPQPRADPTPQQRSQFSSWGGTHPGYKRS